MAVRANIDARFLSRLGLTGLALIAFALWFLYDGAFTYPGQRERALEYQKLEKEDRLDEWKELAKDRGWSTKDPGDPKNDLDIQVQFVIGGLLTAVGLFFFFRYFRARGKWIEATETGLRTSWGQHLEFDRVTSLGKKKWKSKGIAKIYYRQDGRKRRLVLDDWKYDADPTKAILLEVESHIDPGQIVGGPPEPPADKEQGATEQGTADSAPSPEAADFPSEQTAPQSDPEQTGADPAKGRDPA
jgi:hypothetical protein